MASVDTRLETSDLLLEIGAKLFPRRYHRFKDLRPEEEACEWAETLSWQNNPYDRFLLRREILHHLESKAIHDGKWNVYSFASRKEIADEVDHLLDNFLDKFSCIGVFGYVLVTVQWNLAFKHGRISYSKLTSALAKL